jgi:uncharacterized protein
MSFPETLQVALPVLLLCAAAAQVALGIGFSIIAAPILFAVLDAQRVVPLLLALNLLVSIIGVIGGVFANRNRLPLSTLPAAVAIGGVTLLGVALGTWTYGFLSQTMVLGFTGAAILLGSFPPTWLGGVVRAGSAANGASAGLAGLVTAWTASPGPVLAIGLIMSGVPGDRLASTIQPLALVSYAAAFALLGSSGWQHVFANQDLPTMTLWTVLGGILGLILQTRLPSSSVIPSLRIMAAVAGALLIAKALA